MTNDTSPNSKRRITNDNRDQPLTKSSSTWDPSCIGKPVMIDGVLVENYVASQDLNECVDALLKKGIKHSNSQLIPAVGKI